VTARAPSDPVGPDDAAGPVAICGGGLVGGSLALALRGAGHRDVRVADRDPAVLRVLAARDPGLTLAGDWEAVAAGVAVAVAAVPPSAVAGVLASAAAAADGTALLTDVAGVKAGLGAEVRAALGGDAVRYVGGHPMAGSERSGPAAADPTLFAGATWILTPTDVTADRALRAAGDLVRTVGARVLVLDPAAHDATVALVSHLPQLVASVLADVAAEAVGAERDAVLAVAGPGFRDTTRIAASDPALWLDVLAANREAVGAALAAFGARLDEVATAIRDGDAEALRNVLVRAGAARRRLLPKALDAPTTDLVVPLRDRPGELARITAVLGRAGVNIEDLGLRHASTADRGSLVLRVRTASVDRAESALADAGVDGVRRDGGGVTP
jgi:prephenate dehydrogenase